MTRFARARGSKSSNEKAPEDSTPWEVMKEQLLQTKKENEDAKKRLEAENQRIENYRNFLKEQKVQKKKATWCEFPETPINQQGNEQPTNKKRKKEKKEVLQTLAAQSTKVSDITNEQPTLQKKKKNKKKNNEKTDHSKSMPVNDMPEDSNPTTILNVSKSSEKKKNKKSKHPILTNQSEQYENNQEETPSQNLNAPGKGDQNNKQKKKNPKKLVNGKPVRRKEINDHSFQLIINGKEVELVRFDGFPVMKKDAERLQELKNNMIKKGIPKSEVQRTMKLERRRAEKALARMKRDVCYNCRKGGHNLSDCPELKSKIPGVDAPDGVCFKCGSTEHKQFECKVQKDMEFKFATCFICREPGHIARQCPDNPKGLYPNGGSCKLCGDVTHLRKDCPTVNNQKEETSIKLPTLEDNNIEDIGVQQKSSNVETVRKPKKIKF